MTDRDYICLECGKRFPDRSLDSHIEGIKTVERKVEAETIEAYAHERCDALIVPFQSKR